MTRYVLPALAAAGVLVMPALAQARPVAFEIKLKNYGGDGAYVAVYVVDKAGAYQGTLWMAGGKSKYYSHLRDWARASGGAVALDGVTGASVGAGKTLAVSVDLADALFDSGFAVRVDTSVENMRDNPSDVAAPLTAAGAGKPLRGKGYVESFVYKLQ
jgi:hypothetical protein